MKHTETKQKNDVATGIDLRLMAGELRENMKQIRRLMSGAAEVLLAGADILAIDDEVKKELEENRKYLSRELPEPPECSAGTGDEETAEPEVPLEACTLTIEQVEKLLDSWRPSYQKAVLRHVMDRMPERAKEFQQEEKRDAARDEFVNYVLNNTSDEEETRMYLRLLALVQSDAGFEVLQKTA